MKDMQMNVTRIVVCAAVPSAVKVLQMDIEPTTHSLTATWETAVGVYDAYILQLKDEDKVVVANFSVPAGVTRHLFEGLTPGRFYIIHLKTLSNSTHSKEVTATGQTRKAHYFITFIAVSSHTIEGFLLP